MAWTRTPLGALLFLLLAALAADAEVSDASWDGSPHAEHVRRIDVQLELTRDNRLRVVEQIDYCFGTNERHGIFRTIPLRGWYGRALGFHLESVVDGDGEPVPHEWLSQESEARIRIGDPDVTITGPRRYRIRYEVEGAARGGQDSAELSWAAVGPDWEVPIDEASVRVVMPGDTSPREAECRLGNARWSSAECVAIATESEALAYEITAPLRKHERFDIRVELSPDAFDPGALPMPRPAPAPAKDAAPSTPGRRIAPALGWELLAIPLVLGPLFLLAGTLLGRDRGRRGSVVARFDAPEGISPAEAQLLHEERVDRRAVSATILDLAVRGFIEIEPVVDYQVFHKRKEPKTEELGAHEWILFRAIFDSAANAPEAEALAARSSILGGEAARLLQSRDEVTSVPSARLRRSLPPVLDDFERAVREQVVEIDGLFVRAPSEQRRRWLVGLAGVLGFPALLLMSAGWPGTLAFAITAGCAFQFVRMLPRRTQEGRRRHESVLGLVEFLSRVEQDRLDRRAGDAAQEIADPERLLPYALVLGLLEPWREVMRDVHMEPPSWLETTLEGASRITAEDLVKVVDQMGTDIDSIPSATAAAIQNFEVSASRSAGDWDADGGGSSSSGGGWTGGGGSSSGGSLGGGGGGSW